MNAISADLSDEQHARMREICGISGVGWMNTFLPLPDYEASAKCLDRARLGKQRVEVLQLLKGSWANHPASKMWRGYEGSLAWYGLVICNEWLLRGYRDTCFQKIRELRDPDLDRFPPWFGDEAFHASHRSNLLRKDILHYSQFGWSEPPTLPYVWPTCKITTR